MCSEEGFFFLPHVWFQWVAITSLDFGVRPLKAWLCQSPSSWCPRPGPPRVDAVTLKGLSHFHLHVGTWSSGLSLPGPGIQDPYGFVFGPFLKARFLKKMEKSSAARPQPRPRRPVPPSAVCGCSPALCVWGRQ